jgi:hypothetical protein
MHPVAPHAPNAQASPAEPQPLLVGACAASMVRAGGTGPGLRTPLGDMACDRGSRPTCDGSPPS